MHKLKSLALLALAGLGLSASGGVTTNDWWDVPFTSPTAATDVEGYGGVALTIGEIGALTNNFRGASAQQPYLAGLWTMVDGDESYVTNEFNPTNTWKAFGGDNCLKLDTQGNDLTWTVDQDNVMADGLKALVDADLYLVGSDSEPTDFDEGNDVQTAVYLKNEIEEDSGETTNSVLCVYVRDTETGGNYWQELAGVELEDNAWAHVQVLVDHSEDATTLPTVQVFVNGTQMHARNGDATSWTAANGSTAQTAGHVSSVAFRGTGAVDNFVGQTILDDPDKYDFTAEVYMDGVLQAVGTEGNVSRIVVSNEVGKTAPFRGFAFHDYVSGVKESTFSLTKIELVNQGNGAITTLNYTYQNHQIVPETVSQYVDFKTDIYYEEDDDGEQIEIEYQTGEFDVEAPTEGATSNGVVAKIYFEELPAEGDFKLKVTQNVGTAPAEQKFNTNTLSVASTTFTFAEALTDGGTSYVLSKIVLGAAPAGISLDYTSPNAVVTVPLSDQIAEGTYNVATATYAEGTLGADETLSAALVNGEWVFTKKTKPVAIIVAGNVTNEYDSLRGAITNATPGDTIYLVADDHVSFTAEAPELMIDKAITIDGGSNTLYGVSGHACATIEDRHNLAISGTGDVTIKDLTMTQFSDTATVQYYTYPIWVRGAYGGTLTLDGVTITDFSRTAVNISGGAVVITNCVFTGDTTRLDANGHAFQGGVEVGNGLDALVTIADTTITGMGSVGYPTDSDSDMAAAVQMSGKGSITIENGTFAGQYSLIVSATATGGIVVNGGKFDGDVCVENGAGTLAIHDGSVVGDLEVPSALTAFIDGGWFETAPAATYLADGYKVVEDVSGAPFNGAYQHVVPDVTTYLITFMNGETTLYTTQIVENAAVAYVGETPVKEGTDQYSYTFAGWTNAVAGGPLYAGELPAAAGDTTYTAAFTETVNRYDVTFTVDGTTVATTNAPYGDTLYGPADPVKTAETGYEVAFAGWTNAVAGGAVVAAADLPAVTGAATWAAVFTTTAIEYTVTVALDGGTLASGDSIPATYTVETAAFILPTPTKEGFTFKGWVDGDNQPVTQIAGGTTGSISLTATWEEVSGVVEVNPGDGLAKYKTDHPDATVPEPIEFTSDATPLCKIAFVAPADGKYVLMTSTTVNGTYLAEGTPTAYEAGALVQLTETSSATTKFFKIGYEK